MHTFQDDAMQKAASASGMAQGDTAAAMSNGGTGRTQHRNGARLEVHGGVGEAVLGDHDLAPFALQPAVLGVGRVQPVYDVHVPL